MTHFIHSESNSDTLRLSQVCCRNHLLSAPGLKAMALPCFHQTKQSIHTHCCFHVVCYCGSCPTSTSLSLPP